MAELDGRVALVTGASRGIGAAVAVRLAEGGAAVAVTARTLDEVGGAPLPGSLRATLARIEAAGGTGVAVAADLSDPDARAGIVPAVEAALGPVDVLVNNAAAAMYAPAAEMPLRRRRLLFELNVHAPVDLAQAVLPAMRARGAGWIVNVSSATADPRGAVASARVAATPYGASKAALERFSVGLAAEVGADGVAVNAVAPVAAVRTEGAEALLGELFDQLGEDHFEPVAQVVEAIAFLCSCPVGAWNGRVLTTRALLDELG
jgi:citronellol/citronellal dehydrogenase